jgi:putative inorganic carbon (hco3(-)) transporter
MKAIDKLLEYLIYAYIIILPLFPSKYKISGIPFNGDAILAAVILVYLMKLILDRSSREKFARGLKDFFTHSLGISMALLIFVMFFSILYSMDRSMAIRESARFTTYIIMFFIIKYEINQERVLRNIIMVYFLVCAYIFWDGMNEYARAVMKTGSFSYSWELRAASTMENYNNFGAFALMAFFPAFMLFAGEKKWLYKMIYGIIALGAMGSIIVSFSRNALLGVVVGFILLIILYSRKFIIAFVLAGAAALMMPATRTRILQIADMSQNESRLKVWKTAYYMIKDHFLLGVGNGNFYTQYPGYIEKHPELVNTYDWEQVFHPHNILLKIQSELGVLGSAAFLGVIISHFMDLYRYLKNERDPHFLFFFKGFLVSSISFMMMNLIDNYFSAPKVIAYFWLLLAIYQSRVYNGNGLSAEKKM